MQRKCDFCQAPNNYENPLTKKEIFQILNWCKKNKILSVKITGGEPTIRKDLPDILWYCREIGITTTLCTNGICFEWPLVEVVKKTHTKVKISLHGSKEIHERMIGRHCYSNVLNKIRILRDEGIFVSIQAIIHPENIHEIDFLINLCKNEKIKKLSFIPLVPRGKASNTKYSSFFDFFDEKERLIISSVINKKQRRCAFFLDIRYLDFWTNEYFSIETNGDLTIQRYTDKADTKIKNLLLKEWS